MWLLRIIAGFAVIFFVFEGIANLLYAVGIMRPAAFYITAAFALAAAFAVECILFRQTIEKAWHALGLGRPEWRAIAFAAGISLVMFAGYPVLSALTGATFPWPDAWLLMFLGVFVMNGIAEEVMVRGFLFGHLRENYSFWRSVVLVALFHGAAHIPILITEGPIVGISAIAVALVSGPPFAWLYERAGKTIWAGAIVHFAADTVVVLIPSAAMTNPAMQAATLGWLLVVAVVPYLAFFLRPRKANTIPAQPAIETLTAEAK